MRQKAKWLQNNRVIRTAGALLMVSPFFNILFTAYLTQNPLKTWSAKHFLTVLVTGSFVDWLSRITNLVVGFLMFRGKSSAWVVVLLILAFSITQNLYTFSHYYHLNKIITIGSLVINVGLFLLVLEAEYRVNMAIGRRESSGGAVLPTVHAAPVVPIPIKSQPKPREFYVTKGMAIDFQGHGRVAEVLNCDDQELWLKTYEPVPEGFYLRPLVLEDLEQKMTVSLHFHERRGQAVVIFKLVG